MSAVESGARLLLISPFALQGLAMAVDEGYFHRQRGLPRWERIGHPLDTLTILACFGWLALVPPSPFSSAIYLGLAAFSCLFVTKDEFVHAKFCSPAEQWLHAVLFVLHPLVLAAGAVIWPALHLGGEIPWSGLTRYLGVGAFEAGMVWTQLAIICGFLLYQVGYWNFVWKPSGAAMAQRSIP